MYKETATVILPMSCRSNNNNNNNNIINKNHINNTKNKMTVVSFGRLTFSYSIFGILLIVFQTNLLLLADSVAVAVSDGNNNNNKNNNNNNNDNIVQTTTVTSPMTTATTTTTTSFPNNNKNDTKNGERIEMDNNSMFVPSWYDDFFHLPSNVPFPGTGWLQRLSISDTTTTTPPTPPFVYNGKQYSSIYEAIVLSKEDQEDAGVGYHPCRNLNAYFNSFIFSNTVAIRIVEVIANGNIELGHYVLCYIRNLIAATILYYTTALLFSYGCYIWYGKRVFDEQNRSRPTLKTMYNQIQLAQFSLFLYVLLPVLDEYVIEQHWTVVYYTISEIGGIYWYFACTILYFTFVEIGIYWMHRTLHTNKWLYKHIHMKHHQYNRPDTLTPFASIAFHPIDGILQASPYCIAMFVIPCHYVTHLCMLFFTAIWATYIHDAMDWNIDPIMGSKYHTIHHTHYIYNYGQVFTFCDRYWNTLFIPTNPTGVVIVPDNTTTTTTKKKNNNDKQKQQ